MRFSQYEPIWSPLRIRGFRRLWMGQLLSDFANWLDFVALNVLIVYVWGHGAAAVAGLSVCIGLPWIIVGPLISQWISGMPVRRTLILCDILRAIIVISMIWASSLGILFLCVFLKMSVSAVFDPLRQGAVKELVEPEVVAQAASLSQLSVNLTKIFGPLIGGILIGWIGTDTLFMIGAGCYAVSAFFLTGMPETRGLTAEKPAAKAGLHLAWQHLKDRPLLKAAILYTAMLFFCIFLYDGLLVLLIRDAGLEEDDFGLIVGATGTGSVIGSLAAGHWSYWKLKPLSQMTLAGAVSGILIIILGLSVVGWVPSTLWLWLLICVMLGVCSSQGAVPLGYILQKETTCQTISSISALSNALQTISMLVAPIAGSLLAHLIGAGMVFLLAGLMICGLGLLFRFRIRYSSDSFVDVIRDHPPMITDDRLDIVGSKAGN